MAPLDHTAHRPWPLPQRPWVMAMRWLDVLFLHWPVRPEVLRRLIPAPLELETFDGRAWIGVVPFQMTGVRPRGLPERVCSLAFPELNVRTYMAHAGRPGVWFFSLDATNRLAVRAARLWYGLLYYDAYMRWQRQGERVHYTSQRTHRGAPPAAFEAVYWPAGEVYGAAPGTLDYWSTERYCLYTIDRRGGVGCGEIHHRPWPLQPAEVEIRQQTMTQPLAIELPRQEPVRHFARHQEVVAWALQGVVSRGQNHRR
jgi:uncharacterized protein